jgi:hypothetical protein
MRRPFGEVQSALGKPAFRCENSAQFTELTRSLTTQSGKSHEPLPEAQGEVWVYVTTNLPTPDGHMFVYFDGQGQVARVVEVGW